MSALTVTPLYALALVALLLVLSARVILRRRDRRIALGDGDDAELRGRVRAQANFAEYVPFALLLMAMAEANGASAPRLHLLGASLLVGRLLHAWGVGRAKQDLRARTLGMVLTFAVLIGAALSAAGLR